MRATYRRLPWRSCSRGKGIAPLVNYTLSMVGGAHGGILDNSSSNPWNKSFHGDQEIVAVITQPLLNTNLIFGEIP